MSDVGGRVAEIRERCEAATAGEWSAGEEIGGEFFWQYGDFGWYVSGPAGAPELADSEQGKADARFIAAARSDVPFLLAELAVARGQVERVEKLCDDASRLGPVAVVGVPDLRTALLPSREQATP